LTTQNIEYRYEHAAQGEHHGVLLPTVDAIVAELKPKTVFDLGCGNGSVAKHLSDRCAVTGIEPSESAVRIANEAYPDIRIEIGSAYDDLAAKYGQFDMVLSLEVVEHLYDPRKYAKAVADLLRPGGHAVISTPYHGYWKNLALAITGQMDRHFWALWDGGHIKFWSVETLSELLREQGLEIAAMHRVGRIPPLAKSMIAVARKPG
jgi:2-polyprenyl-3-methyl-5-hydroxy-6-metoxy-1,4-benzoquinol methylase